jgi:hypothetical protein
MVDRKREKGKGRREKGKEKRQGKRDEGKGVIESQEGRT